MAGSEPVWIAFHHHLSWVGHQLLHVSPRIMYTSTHIQVGKELERFLMHELMALAARRRCSYATVLNLLDQICSANTSASKMACLAAAAVGQLAAGGLSVPFAIASVKAFGCRHT